MGGGGGGGLLVVRWGMVNFRIDVQTKIYTVAEYAPKKGWSLILLLPQLIERNHVTNLAFGNEQFTERGNISDYGYLEHPPKSHNISDALIGFGNVFSVRSVCEFLIIFGRLGRKPSIGGCIADHSVVRSP